VGQGLELIVIKFPIPEKEISILLQASTVTQSFRPIV
jgi:hypothetical protein